MPHILIVCTANICRSPMAEVLLRRRLEQAGLADTWSVASAGTRGINELPASEKGRILMAEWGLDLAAHRSRIATGEMVAAADLVLTMERGHKEALQAEVSHASGWIFLLSEMVGEAFEIVDPFGGPMVEYEETASEIDDLLGRGFGRIVEIAQANSAGRG